MNKVESYLKEYSESHLNRTNILIHTICVPLIFFSLFGLILSLELYLGVQSLTLGIMFLVMMYYFLLSKKHFIYMLPVFFITYLLNMLISLKLDLFSISLGIFCVSWAFQIYGHKVEGKKPSFFKDLQFLLIGPLWTINKLIGSKF
jgi:uncharacterized membrane protein YGL010W